MRIEDLSTWESFLAVSKTGGFSRAAKELRIPVPQVSKRVAKLENQLGVRLFQRTTRSVSLTNEGKSLFPKINSIIEDLKEAESLFETQENFRGKIKLTCVPFVAHSLLIPLLKEFYLKFPDIHIELNLSQRFVNIVDESYDMAIRIETPKDSDLIYRKLAPNNLIFCASPEYLKKEKPRKPSDLKDHSLLVMGIHHRCKFQNSEDKISNYISSKQIICDDGVFLTNMARNGMGVLVRSVLDVKDSLNKGELVQVLEDYPLETFGNIYAVIPSKRFLAPRVRAFLDFILKRI